jgi:hypothetical protein
MHIGKFVKAMAIVSIASVIPFGVVAETITVALDSTVELTTHKVDAARVVYKGREALRVTEADEPTNDEDKLVIINGSEFSDGVIEVDLAAAPRKDAGEFARGFVGIAFRVAADVSTFEAIYLRPTNGRAPQQIRRNHSVQYISHPAYPWHRLRKETPGHYEAHVDLVPGEWTKVRVVVRGTEAKLYVHGSEQPALIVSDLKLGEGSGAVGLWIGPGTEAHFAGLSIGK